MGSPRGTTNSGQTRKACDVIYDRFYFQNFRIVPCRPVALIGPAANSDNLRVIGPPLQVLWAVQALPFSEMLSSSPPEVRTAISTPGEWRDVGT